MNLACARLLVDDPPCRSRNLTPGDVSRRLGLFWHSLLVRKATVARNTWRQNLSSTNYLSDFSMNRTPSFGQNMEVSSNRLQLHHFLFRILTWIHQCAPSMSYCHWWWTFLKEVSSFRNNTRCISLPPSTSFPLLIDFCKAWFNSFIAARPWIMTVEFDPLERLSNLMRVRYVLDLYQYVSCNYIVDRWP